MLSFIIIVSSSFVLVDIILTIIILIDLGKRYNTIVSKSNNTKSKLAKINRLQMTTLKSKEYYYEIERNLNYP